MQSVKIDLVAWTAGLYLIMPKFIRLGPVSLYMLIILAVCVIYLLQCKVTIPNYTFGNVGWNVRGALILLAMVKHNEYAAIILYMVAPVLLFLLLICSIRSEERLNKYLDVLIWCSAINAVICFVEVFTGFNLPIALCNDGTMEYVPLYRNGILRVYGAFVNPINNGIFCMMITGLILYRIYSGKLSAKSRKAFWWIWAANIVVIFLTSSRAALLSALMVNLVLLQMAGVYRLNAKRLIVLFVIVMAVLLLALIPNPLTEWVRKMLLTVIQLIDDLFGTNIMQAVAVQGAVEGVGNRLDLFDWVMEATGNDYIFGKGRTAKFEYVVNFFGFIKRSIENQYLSEYFRYGLVGLCSKVFLFIYLLISSFFRMRRERKAGVHLGLNAVLLMVFSAYFLSLFTVAQNEEEKLFYLLVVLGEIYARKRFYLKDKGVNA